VEALAGFASGVRAAGRRWFLIHNREAFEGQVRSTAKRDAPRRDHNEGFLPMAMFARLVIASSLLMLTTDLSAHDSWISRGGHRNAAGEWCCGEGDCLVVPGAAISTTPQGYLLSGAETVPYSEAQPSPDGAFWRCKRPDGTRRCFFAPPPSN
jgi:hypothetical protein